MLLLLTSVNLALFGCSLFRCRAISDSLFSVPFELLRLDDTIIEGMLDRRESLAS
jgi:hypothetical protein